MASNATIRIDFLSIRNAGRSQIAAVLAERERDERGLDAWIDVHSAGTEPADRIEGTVLEVIEEIGVDISDREPSDVVLDDLVESDYVVTMGCSVRELDPARYGVVSRSWDVVNPEGADIETVRTIRDELRIQVAPLFDEIKGTTDDWLWSRLSPPASGPP